MELASWPCLAVEGARLWLLLSGRARVLKRPWPCVNRPLEETAAGNTSASDIWTRQLYKKSGRDTDYPCQRLSF